MTTLLLWSYYITTSNATPNMEPSSVISDSHGYPGHEEAIKLYRCWQERKKTMQAMLRAMRDKQESPTAPVYMYVFFVCRLTTRTSCERKETADY